MGALAGIKVIDFGQMVSAPFCAKLFSDYGADVVKVELPEGDAARRAGPFPQDIPHPEKSGLFFINNTNKRGITCDVSSAAGRDLFLRLVDWADVLIENHRPGQMRAWGLDHEQLLQRNPALADRLFDELGRARIVKPARMPGDVVSIGSTATYRDETTGQEKSVTLVYPEDADITRQRVSVMTPIGVALLGLAEGAAFYWDTRDNQRRMLTVIRVEPAVAAKPGN